MDVVVAAESGGATGMYAKQNGGSDEGVNTKVYRLDPE